jgi:hypothetical protein
LVGHDVTAMALLTRQYMAVILRCGLLTYIVRLTIHGKNQRASKLSVCS